MVQAQDCLSSEVADQAVSLKGKSATPARVDNDEKQEFIY
jgi:hypothetical protein